MLRSERHGSLGQGSQGSSSFIPIFSSFPVSRLLFLIRLPTHRLRDQIRQRRTFLSFSSSAPSFSPAVSFNFPSLPVLKNLTLRDILKFDGKTSVAASKSIRDVRGFNLTAFTDSRCVASESSPRTNARPGKE